MVFIDEATIEYDPCLATKKMYVPVSEEIYKKNLRLSFKLRRINLGDFACIAKRSRTSLILVRKKSKKEHTSTHDKLNFNAYQFIRDPPTSYNSSFVV